MIDGEINQEDAEMGVVRAGVISDTHGLLRPEVLRRLEGCGCILHAGDFGRESILEELENIAPVYAVRGNNDWGWGERLPRELRFEVGGVEFLMTHDRAKLPRFLGDAQAVVFGHSHRYHEERFQGRLWLNPGSCGWPRFGKEVTMAMLTIKDGTVQVERIDLEA